MSTNLRPQNSSDSMSRHEIDRLLNQAERHLISGQLEIALDHSEKALAMALRDQDALITVKTLTTIAATWTAKGKYTGNDKFLEKALRYLKKGQKIQLNKIGIEQIDLFLKIGDVYKNYKNTEEAFKHYEKALVLARQLQYGKGINQSLTALSQLYLVKNDFQTALLYAKESLELSEKVGDKILLANCYNQFGQIYLRQYDYGKITAYFSKVLQYSKETQNVEAELLALNGLAMAHTTYTRYKEAMDCLLLALEKSRAISYRSNEANCLVNIGTIYAHLFNHTEALKRYIEVVEVYDDVLSEKAQIIVLNNVGNIHSIAEQHDKALKYFYRALILATDAQNEQLMALTYAQLSRTFIEKSRFNEAKVYAMNAQDIFEELDNTDDGKHINLLNLAKLSMYEEDYYHAIIYAKLSVITSKKLNDLFYQLQGYNLLANIYELKGDFQKALAYQKEYNLYKNGEFEKLRDRYRMDMEIEYALKKKEIEVVQLTKENQYQSLLLEKSQQITIKNEKLQNANEELKQFAYVVSHDLREPLRMINSYSKLLKRNYGNQVDEDGHVFMNYILDGSKRMENLLEDLLRYATIGRQKKDLERIDLNLLLLEVIDNLRIKMMETDAEVIIDSLPIVQNSSSLMIQLFQNFISNAIKFRKKEKPIIHLKYRPLEDYHEFRIIDNGIGIAPYNQKRIFEIFQRLHNRKDYEGTGIGLAICNKIVNSFGGKIRVESVLGEGTTFYFTLAR